MFWDPGDVEARTKLCGHVVERRIQQSDSLTLKIYFVHTSTKKKDYWKYRVVIAIGELSKQGNTR